MDPKTGLNSKEQRLRRRVTLAQYIRLRNGVPAGYRGGLRNMFHRSFGANSFAGFWQNWNPVFGYALARYVFSPLQQWLPSTAALIATFVFCGALHDLVTTAVRGSFAFLFTPWFFFLGMGVVSGQAIRMNLSGYPWAIRATVNLAYIIACLTLTLIIKGIFEI